MKKQTASALLSTCMVLSTASTAFAAQDLPEMKQEKSYNVSATSILATQSLGDVVSNQNIDKGTVKEWITERSSSEVNTEEELKTALKSAQPNDVITVTGSGFELSEAITIPEGVTIIVNDGAQINVATGQSITVDSGAELNVGKHQVIGKIIANPDATVTMDTAEYYNNDEVPSYRDHLIGEDALAVLSNTVEVDFTSDKTTITIPQDSKATIQGAFTDLTGDKEAHYTLLYDSEMIVNGNLAVDFNSVILGKFQINDGGKVTVNADEYGNKLTLASSENLEVPSPDGQKYQGELVINDNGNLTIKDKATLDIGAYQVKGKVTAEAGAGIDVMDDTISENQHMIGSNGLKVTEGTVTVDFESATTITIPQTSVAEICGVFMDTTDGNDAYCILENDTMVVEGELNLRSYKMEVLGKLNVTGTVNVMGQTLALVKNNDGSHGGTMTVDASGNVRLIKLADEEAILDIVAPAKAEGAGTLSLNGGKITGDGENTIRVINDDGESDTVVDVPPASVDDSGTASTDVDNDDISNTIGSLPTSGGSITIDATMDSSADAIIKSQVTLKGDALNSLTGQNSKVTEVEVKTDMGTITVDKAFLGTIAESAGEGQNVTLNIEKQENDDVAAIEAESDEIYDITFTKDDGTEIPVNNTNIKLALQFSGLTDTKDKNIGWKNDTGSGKIDSVTFEPVAGVSNTYKAIFITNHLTQFYVVNKTTIPQLGITFQDGGLGEKGTITGVSGTDTGTYFTIQVTDPTTGANAIYTVEIPGDRTADISVPDNSTVQVWETAGAPQYNADGTINDGNVKGYIREVAADSAKK